MGFFDQVPLATPDPIFGLQVAYKSDPRPQKVNLTVGLYKTADLQTPVLTCVKKAEEEILKTEKSKEYLPLDGHKLFLEQVGQLIFGEHIWSQSKERMARSQTVGGTNALRVGGELLVHEKIAETIFLPEPSWPNHKAVFMRCGLKIEKYPYYDAQKNAVDFTKLCDFLGRLSPKSLVLLHASCHNPTGADLTLEQWKKLSALFREKHLIPFFDLAYQGFGRGLEEDAEAVRLFAQEGHEFLLAYSLSKNFSLYAERVGALFVIGETHKITAHVASKLIFTTRPNYSNPPLHGAQIAATILSSAALKKQWEEELTAMRNRSDDMRIKFADALIKKNPKRDFSFLKERLGLFSFCGLTLPQVEKLIKEYSVFVTNDGRINVAGLNPQNLDYVVQSISSVL